MERNSTLIDDIAYAGFEINYEIFLKYKRSNTDGTLIWAKEKDGDTDVEAEDEPLAAVALTDSYESDVPNQAREDHNLPIPVMIPGPQGPVKERIHISEAQKARKK